MSDFNLFLVSKIEARRLRKGLKEQAIVIESTRLVGMRDQLQKELNDPSISEEEKKDIKSEINSVQRKIYNVRLLPEEKLFDVPQTAFDWHKISIQNVRFVNLFQYINLFFYYSRFLTIVWQIAHSGSTKTLLDASSSTRSQYQLMDT